MNLRRHFNEKIGKTEFGLNAFYFLPDPIALALDHYCSDRTWALLPNSRPKHESGISSRTPLGEFENDPRRPGFYVFRCAQVFDLQAAYFLDRKNSLQTYYFKQVAPTDAETTVLSEAEFVVSFGQEITPHRRFSYTIVTGDKSETFHGQSLNQWGITF